MKNEDGFGVLAWGLIFCAMLIAVGYWFAQ